MATLAKQLARVCGLAARNSPVLRTPIEQLHSSAAACAPQVVTRLPGLLPSGPPETPFLSAPQGGFPGTEALEAHQRAEAFSFPARMEQLQEQRCAMDLPFALPAQGFAAQSDPLLGIGAKERADCSFFESDSLLYGPDGAPQWLRH